MTRRTDAGKIEFDGAEYTVEITGNATNGYVITNSYTPEQTEAEVLKVWDDEGYEDQRPESLRVDLYANGKKIDSVTLDESNRWTDKIEELIAPFEDYLYR